MTSDEILLDAEERMDKALGVFRDDLRGLRTGRATPALVDHLRVDYYGSPTPLKQLATIHAPEAQLLTVQPFDKSSIGTIERSIMQSDLGLTPSNDGQVIRLAFPQLTAERRKELVKVVKHRSEDARVAVRNIRRAARHDLEAFEKEGELSEDDLDRAEKELEKLTHEFIAEIDKMLEHKEQELLEV